MMQQAQLMCPFQCGGKMVILQGEQGPKVLMHLLLEPHSVFSGMIEGSLARRPRGTFMQCNTCEFMAIFPANGR